MARDTYSGFAMNAVDAKNRLSIPADHRAVIEAKSQQKILVLAPHDGGLPCLIGYDTERLSEIKADLKTEFGVARSADREKLTRRLLGLAAPVPYDDAGRILLSADWRELGGIGKFVVFIGMGDYFEIWDADTVLREQHDDPVLVGFVTRAMKARSA